MMKKVFALLALAASLAACARMEQPVNETPEGTPEGTETPARTYTLTVKATKDAGTRALELVTDGETHRQTLNAKWAEGEAVIVFKEAPSLFPGAPGMPTRIGALHPSEISDGGQSCTLVGELDAEAVETVGGINNGDALQLVFYGSLAAAGGGDHPQDGTLATIQDYHDLAFAYAYVSETGDGGFSADDGEGNAVTFTNGQAIVRFVLRDRDGNAVTPGSVSVTVTHEGMEPDEPVTFSDFADTYAANGCFFLALKGLETYDFRGSISLSATAGTDTYTYWRSGVTFNAGQYYSIAVKMVRYSGTFDLSDTGIYENNIFTARDGNVLMGTSPEGKQVRIDGGATVTLNGVSIERDAYAHDGIALDGSATLLLEGTNTVSGGSSHAGISVPSGSTLTIDGGGSLTATGGGYAAGIGSGSDGTSGAITISGGTVTANGGSSGAGIGSGSDGTSGAITLSGGTVTANGGGNGAGIGSGAANRNSEATCGVITISGGTVTATGGTRAAGIGSGFSYMGTNSCGAITISGGTVTANGGGNGAGIGSGEVNGGGNGAGIGSGEVNGGANSCGAITISGGTVTATGKGIAAGIGSGDTSNGTNSCGAITISQPARVMATKGQNASCSIGPASDGSNNRCESVTINGKLVGKWENNAFQRNNPYYNLTSSPLSINW